MIHKIHSLEDLEVLLQAKKLQNYAFISYLTGEYGISINFYKTYVYQFYKEMQKRNIKTIAFVFKNMTSFAHNCCDEIIEYQDIEFENNDSIIASFQDLVPNTSYQGNDGWAFQYIRGITCKKYEDILQSIDFENIFYTLHLDGSRHINKIDNCVQEGEIHLYKIMNQNCMLHNVHNYRGSYCIVDEKYNRKNKYKCIAIWIRNTNKWDARNLKPETYNTVFSYCIENQIICYVFLDLIPVELPNSSFIINSTDRFKNRPNWDGFLNILQHCDFFIGTDSGSSEYVLLNAKLNCLFDRNIQMRPHLSDIISSNTNEGIICKTIHFPSQFASIMNIFYAQ